MRLDYNACPSNKTVLFSCHPSQVIEAADLAKYLASAAQTGLEYLDGRYVDTANKAAQTDPRLPAVPPPPTRSTAEARAAAGAADRSPAQAPFVAGLKQAGAAVKSGK